MDAMEQLRDFLTSKGWSLSPPEHRLRNYYHKDDFRIDVWDYRAGGGQVEWLIGVEARYEMSARIQGNGVDSLIRLHDTLMDSLNGFLKAVQ